MSVCRGTDASLISVLEFVDRAVVLLSVEWSIQARRAAVAFRAAAEDMQGEGPPRVRFFSGDEDEDWCQAYLATLGIPRLGEGYQLGAGSMIWLEGGKPVSHRVDGYNMSRADIVERTRRLWPHS